MFMQILDNISCKYFMCKYFIVFKLKKLIIKNNNNNNN